VASGTLFFPWGKEAAPGGKSYLLLPPLPAFSSGTFSYPFTFDLFFPPGPFSLGRFYSHKHKKKELSMNLKIIKTKEKYLIDRSFNKYDLKEYLSKLYGLKVQKITTRVLRNGLKKAVCLMVK
jgi:hypothetical protein